MTEEVVSEVPTKETEALAIVRSSMGWSAGAGLVPVPGLDLAAIVGVQLKMVQSLSKVYGVNFTSDLVKPLVTTLISGGGSLLLGGAAVSLVKGIPILGSIAGMLTLPALAAASCWATGKVFIRHFESGGTFLDFDPAKAKAYYAEQFAEAKAAA